MIASRLAAVRKRISVAATAAGVEAAGIRLLAVSKGQASAALRRAAALGLSDFGENYVAEALGKMDDLSDLPLCWHFIGAVQGNKTRLLATHFDWVHSLVSAAHARRLSTARGEQREPLSVCLQLYPGGDRSGVVQQRLADLAQQIDGLPGLRLRGLMILPLPGRESQSFAFARQAFVSLRRRWPRLDTLSMGMSADLEVAIAAGSNCVRVGTALFGARGY